jgi:hypothetical protein
MSPPRPAVQRPLVAVLCACALIAAALLLLRAAGVSGDGPALSAHADLAGEPTATPAEPGPAESGPADDGDDEAVAHLPVAAYQRGNGTPLVASAPHAAAAATDPPQSPPPEA